MLVNGSPWEEVTPSRIATLSNKFSKTRVGVKAAKKAELLNNAREVLTQEEATGFRALSARANYLAMYRPDISFSSKELCREFAQPSQRGIQKLKRRVRYLKHNPRLVWRFDAQARQKKLDVHVDTDFAGCWRTRRSTSGGVARLGSHMLTHGSITQSTVALSRAEADLTGMCNGNSIGLGLKALASDLGVPVSLRVHSDASAAIGMVRRRGLGKVRHLAVADLWIQDTVATKEIALCKVKGSENPADMLTKYVESKVLETHKSALGLIQGGGRASSASAASEVIVQTLACSLSCISRRGSRHRGGVLNRKGSRGPMGKGRGAA